MMLLFFQKLMDCNSITVAKNVLLTLDTYLIVMPGVFSWFCWSSFFFANCLKSWCFLVSCACASVYGHILIYLYTHSQICMYIYIRIYTTCTVFFNRYELYKINTHIEKKTSAKVFNIPQPLWKSRPENTRWRRGKISCLGLESPRPRFTLLQEPSRSRP